METHIHSEQLSDEEPDYAQVQMDTMRTEDALEQQEEVQLPEIELADEKTEQQVVAPPACKPHNDNYYLGTILFNVFVFAGAAVLIIADFFYKRVPDIQSFQV